jgi:hypothetical protein
VSASGADAAALAFARIAELEARVTFLAQQAAAGPSSRATQFAKIRAPSAFAGTMGTGVDDWLEEMQQQFRYYGATKFPDEMSWVRYAVAHFSGNALAWWTRLTDADTITSWAVFVARLHDRFRPVQAAMFARQRLDKLRMKPGHKVNAYVSHFQNIMIAISDMGAADQVHHFVNGLLPPYAAKVWERHPTTLTLAIDYAISAEAMLEFGRNASGVPSRMGTGGYERNLQPSTLSSSAPMEISAMDDESFFTDAPSMSPGAASSETASTSALAELMASFEQRLNALAHSGSHGHQNKARGDRVAGLTGEMIKKLQAEGKCFRCKKMGHMKNECPEKGAAKQKNA